MATTTTAPTTESISYEIKKKIAVLSKNEKTQWTKELRLISWNGGTPKYDIRDWAPDDKKMSKGITLSESEMTAIVDALK